MADDEARTESYAEATEVSPTAATATDGTAKPEDAKPAGQKPEKPDAVAVPIPAEKPPFQFWALLSEVHKMIFALDGYRWFFLKYLGLQLVRLAAAVSFLVVGYVMGDDDIVINDITSEQYGVFVAVGVLYVLGRLVPFATSAAIDKVKEDLQATQATMVLAKIFELQHDAMVSTPTGQFVQLISKVFRNLDTLMPALYGQVIPLTVEVVVATAIVVSFYGPIGFVQPVLFLGYSYVSFKAAAKKAQRNSEMMSAMISEWGNILAAAGSYERAHFFDNVGHEISQGRKSFENIGRKIKVVMGGEHSEGMTLAVISLSITVVFVLVLTLVPEVNGIKFLTLALYFVIFIGSLEAYATGVSNLRTAVFEYQGFDEFLSKRSDVLDAPDAVALAPNKNPMIEFENVCFAYGGKVILDDVSFKVEGGQTVGLVGSSGCGKSTILRLLLRFYRQSSGTITVDGHDITKVTGESLRRLFSVVTQDAQLFNASIRDNIAYGNMGSGDAEILAAAKLAELDLDSGDGDLSLDKICGEKGAKLSGGQQQRVSLARAMLKNGTIYLLDEPTTGLDGVVAKQLQVTLDKLSTNATSICITHHLEDLRAAHHIIYLDSGKIVERGTYEELMAADGVFATQVAARK